ncbi:MAG: putative LPS assembly protein LptD [Bacteroidota bacterium]
MIRPEAGRPAASLRPLTHLGVPLRVHGASVRLPLLTTLLLGIALALSPPLLSAQTADTTATPPDTLRQPLAPTDTLRAAPADTLRQTLAPADTLRPAPATGLPRPAPTTPSEDGLEAPITFTARDTLVVHLGGDGGDRGTLYGEAEVNYQTNTMQAYQVDILFDEDQLEARALEADTGLVGRPTFVQDAETFMGKELAYNMQTKRGRVVEAQTGVPGDEGFVRGGIVKVREDSTVFIADGVYTTCECVEDPSYSLRASRMKVVDQKRIFTGPIRLYLFNIPTILWLPFGYLPAQEGRRSGPLPVQYGEDDRGFYLRGLGWYWAVNDYLGAQVSGGLWSRGSWQVTPTLQYNRRYRYNGRVTVDYVFNRRGESIDPNFERNGRAALRWTHNQTLTPSSSFDANVNLVTVADYLREEGQTYDDRATQTIQSSIAYRQNWPRVGRSFNVSTNQQQNLAQRSASVTLPNLSFTQNSRKPFERQQRGPGERERWYERLTYSYSGGVRNTYAFTPSDTTDIEWWEALVDRGKYREATGDDEPFDFRATHRVPISAPFSINRLPVINRSFILNVTPNATYTEEWYIQTDRRVADTSAFGNFRTVSEPGFFSYRQFSMGASANTTFYGLFPVGVGPYQGVRHTVRPTLGFTYRPDFYGRGWGYTRTFVDPETGEETVYPIVSGVSRGRQQNLTFRLDNVFETKRVEQDSTGEVQRRTLKLLDLGASSSYNFAADSLKLSDIGLTARTTLFGQVNVNSRMTLSPYQIDSVGTSVRTVDRFVFGSGGKFRLARLTQFSVAATTRIQSRRQNRSSQGPTTDEDDLSTVPGPGVGFNPAIGNPFGSGFSSTGRDVADFAIPWSLNFNLNYSVTKRTTQLTRQATANVGFDFNLTPSWKVQGRTGYDFERKELATTNLGVVRDFECWRLSFSWVPFGLFQSYNFSLQVKSGPLQDLLRVNRPRQDTGGRFNNLIR